MFTVNLAARLNNDGVAAAKGHPACLQPDQFVLPRPEADPFRVLQLM